MDDLAAAVWKYEAAKHPWVTCASEAAVVGKVTCRLEEGPEPIRPTQAMIGRTPPVYYSLKLTAATPEIVIPDNLSAGTKISVAARVAGSWTGDVIGELAVPARGARSTYSLPYDVWRVTVTRLDDSEMLLILRYPVTLASGTFAMSKTGKQDYFGALSLDRKTTTRTFHLPTSPGGKISGYYGASSVSGAPHFTIDKPGCYLVNGGTQLIFDDDCQHTIAILRKTEPGADAGVPPAGEGGAAPVSDAGAGSDAGASSDLLPPPPVDPCAGSCTASQACVAGTCVLLAAQTQADCYSSANKPCDLDQNEDCAAGNICSGGYCRRLSCQYQNGCYNPADRPCDSDNADCATGNVCVAGFCRSLSCQYQNGCYSSADRPCDNDNADCTTGNVCVAGFCRALSCQYQNGCYNSADRPCDNDDADCATGNVCKNGVCWLKSCLQ